MAGALRRRAEDVAGLGTARAALFVAPALLMVGLFLLLPALWTIWLGMTSYRLTGLDASRPRFVGLDNFARILADPDFWEAAGLTLVFVVGSGLLGQMVLGFALAWLVRGVSGRVRAGIEGLVLAAWVTPASVSAFLWLALLDRRAGTLNSLLGTEGCAWLIEHPMASIVAFNLWIGTAFSMQLSSSALSSVPPSQLETARMVGATPWQQLRDVVFPNLRGHLLSNALLITLWTCNTFTPFLLTRGGPDGATEILSVYVYRTAIPGGQLGLGAAISWLMLALNLGIALGMTRLSRRAGGSP